MCVFLGQIKPETIVFFISYFLEYILALKREVVTKSKTFEIFPQFCSKNENSFQGAFVKGKSFEAILSYRKVIFTV